MSLLGHVLPENTYGKKRNKVSGNSVQQRKVTKGEQNNEL